MIIFFYFMIWLIWMCIKICKLQHKRQKLILEKMYEHNKRQEKLNRVIDTLEETLKHFK